ncbi:LAETG motif-containing sortase-dependent surface protein [Streptomyces syringium]|uniref:LAETG motif-containing sortase-dependent surface protein n=1 Tax=Streptomyces syringium TaxID=76729 RepID=UPI0034540385
MKLSRITAAVTAASIAPAVFLATPAVADGADAKPAVTAGAEEKPGSAPAGGVKAPSAKEKKAPVITSKDFPKKLTAGGEWTAFSFVVDNQNGEQVKDFTLSFNLFGPEKGNGGPIKPQDPRAARLEYRTDFDASTSSWQSIVTAVSPEKVRGEAKIGEIAKGSKLTVDLHVLLPKSFSVGQAAANVTATMAAAEDVPTPELGAVTIVAKDGGKTDPIESTSPTAKSTATGRTGTKQPTGKATTSASATPTTTATASPSATPTTATPSATASSTWAAAGTTTTGGTGELAKTGADSTTPWAVAGSAAALALGASLVVAARRRGSHEA